MSENNRMKEAETKEMLAEVMRSISFTTYHEITINVNNQISSMLVHWDFYKGKPILSSESLMYLASTGIFAKYMQGASDSNTIERANLCAFKVYEEVNKHFWSPTEKIKRKTFLFAENPLAE